MGENSIYRISLNDESYDIEQGSLTPFHLAVLFGIDERCVVLKETQGNRVYFAENGIFTNIPNNGFSRYTIIQHPASNNTQSNNTNRNNVSDTTDLRHSRSNPFIGCRSTQSTSQQNAQSSSADTNFVDLKIRRVVKQKIGKCIPCQNWDLRIVRNEAKLDIINNRIKEKFGPDYVICDSEGIAIPNSLKYNEASAWGFHKFKPQKPTVWYVAKEKPESLSDFEEDNLVTENTRKRSRMTENDVRSLKKAKEIISTVDKMNKLEVLCDMAKKIFSCSGQCGDVISKNPIICRQCGQIIFCESCKDKWLSTTHSSAYDPSSSVPQRVANCPNCRSPWSSGQGPFCLKGFDDYLNVLRRV